MSYKTREKKRRRNIAIANARPKADRHYLTIVSRAGCCNDCGGSLRPGAECVYRYEPREILCKNCADLRKIRYRLSRRWEKANTKRRQGRLVPAARRVGPGQKPREGAVPAGPRRATDGFPLNEIWPEEDPIEAALDRDLDRALEEAA